MSVIKLLQMVGIQILFLYIVVLYHEDSQKSLRQQVSTLEASLKRTSDELSSTKEHLSRLLITNESMSKIIDTQDATMNDLIRDAAPIKAYRILQSDAGVSANIGVLVDFIDYLGSNPLSEKDIVRTMAITEIESSWRANRGTRYAGGPMGVGYFWINKGNNKHSLRKRKVTLGEVPNSRWLRNPRNNFVIGNTVYEHYNTMARELVAKLDQNRNNIPFYVEKYKDDILGLTLYLYNNGPDTRLTNRKPPNYNYARKVKDAMGRYKRVVALLRSENILPNVVKNI